MLKDIAEDTNHRDTPAAIVAIYDDYNIPIKGNHAAVIGRKRLLNPLLKRIFLCL